MEDERERLLSNKDAVRLLLLDEKWHTNAEIEAEGGFGFSARLKELRDQDGMVILSEHVRRGKWRYRWTGAYRQSSPRKVLGKQRRKS